MIGGTLAQARERLPQPNQRALHLYHIHQNKCIKNQTKAPCTLKPFESQKQFNNNSMVVPICSYSLQHFRSKRQGEDSYADLVGEGIVGQDWHGHLSGQNRRLQVVISTSKLIKTWGICKSKHDPSYLFGKQSWYWMTMYHVSATIIHVWKRPGGGAKRLQHSNPKWSKLGMAQQRCRQRFETAASKPSWMWKFPWSNQERCTKRWHISGIPIKWSGSFGKNQGSCFGKQNIRILTNYIMVGIQVCHLSRLVPSKVSWNALKQDHENLQRRKSYAQGKDLHNHSAAQVLLLMSANSRTSIFQFLASIWSDIGKLYRFQSCHGLKFVGKVLWIPFQNDLHRNDGTHTTSKDHYHWYLSFYVLVSHHALLVVAPNLHSWVATTPEELAMRSTFHWARPPGYELFEGCLLCAAVLSHFGLATGFSIKSNNSETYRNVWSDDVAWSRLILKQAGNHLQILVLTCSWWVSDVFCPIVPFIKSGSLKRLKPLTRLKSLHDLVRSSADFEPLAQLNSWLPKAKYNIS